MHSLHSLTALTFSSPVLLELWSVNCLSAAREEISAEIKCTAHEKMPDIISYQGNANTNHNEMSLTPTRMATVISVDENVEKLEPPYTAMENVKWCSCYRKQYGSSFKR